MQTLPPRMRSSTERLSWVTYSRTVGQTGFNDKYLKSSLFSLCSGNIYANINYSPPPKKTQLMPVQG